MYDGTHCARRSSKILSTPSSARCFDTPDVAIISEWPHTWIDPTSKRHYKPAYLPKRDERKPPFFL